jgi:hypothetical protein
MSTFIQNNQIVLISRNIGYRRSPKIAMDQIKSTRTTFDEELGKGNLL